MVSMVLRALSGRAASSAGKLGEAKDHDVQVTYYKVEGVDDHWPLVRGISRPRCGAPPYLVWGASRSADAFSVGEHQHLRERRAVQLSITP